MIYWSSPSCLPGIAKTPPNIYASAVDINTSPGGGTRRRGIPDTRPIPLDFRYKSWELLVWLWVLQSQTTDMFASTNVQIGLYLYIFKARMYMDTDTLFTRARKVSITRVYINVYTVYAPCRVNRKLANMGTQHYNTVRNQSCLLFYCTCLVTFARL